jgi:bifunctional non-homologous end joining protein LigD
MNKADLFYKDAGSDKVYHCQIEDKGNGTAVVNFQYGRRGSTLTTGTKTEKPVPIEKARAIFDKLVKEKQAKGYSPGEAGTAYQHTDKEQRNTGIVPQLLNEVDGNDLTIYLNSNEWCAQSKFDGKRVLVMRKGNDITGINRKGLSIGLPQAICDAALALKAESFIIDGECIGDKLYAFDLLEMNGHDIRANQAGYGKRLKQLTQLMSKNASPAIELVETAITTDDKTAMLHELIEAKAEGIVFKNLHAASVAGRPNSGGNQLKYKFYATASCVVEKESEDRHSISLKLLDGKKWVSVGKVTIAQALALPKPGSVVEIRYLYAYKGGSLYQPIFEGLRDDIDVKDCKLSQLKYKQDQEEDPE